MSAAKHWRKVTLKRCWIAAGLTTRHVEDRQCMLFVTNCCVLSHVYVYDVVMIVSCPQHNQAKILVINTHVDKVHKHSV